MFSISPINSEETPEITWTTKPVQMKHVPTEMYDPIFRFSFRLLSHKYSRSNSIVLKCSISKTRSCPGRHHAKVVTATNTPCANLQPGCSLEECLKWLSVHGTTSTETQEERTVSETVQETGGASALTTATATPAPGRIDFISWFPTQPGPSTFSSECIPPANRTTRVHTFSLRQPVFGGTATLSPVFSPCTAQQGAVNPNSNKIFKRKLPF